MSLVSATEPREFAVAPSADVRDTTAPAVNAQHGTRCRRPTTGGFHAYALHSSSAPSRPPSAPQRPPRRPQDPNLARNLAATCANCHGTNGVSQGGVESLAGAGKDDMIRKLKEYKAGTKPGTIMPQLAKGYTDAQIDLVAGWFAAQKPAK